MLRFRLKYFSEIHPNPPFKKEGVIIITRYMIIIKTREEIALMRQGGKILAKILRALGEKVKPGIKTEELDKTAEELAAQYGVVASFKNYKPTFAAEKTKDDGFPASLCVSVNEEVVHGIPNGQVLAEGDIVGLDMGIKYKGYFTDAAITVPVGVVSEQAQKLINITKKCLEAGISKVKEGARLGDVGFAIQDLAEQNGFSVVRDLVGHGVGKFVHEDPQVPNYGISGHGLKLKRGMTIAIEPMINMGAFEVEMAPNNWTFAAKDKKYSAHFEHTVAVTKDGCDILTTA